MSPARVSIMPLSPVASPSPSLWMCDNESGGGGVAACVRLSRGCCRADKGESFFATRASKKRAARERVLSVCCPVIAHAKQCNSMCNYLPLQSNLPDKQRIIIKLCVCVCAHSVCVWEIPNKQSCCIQHYHKFSWSQSV